MAEIRYEFIATGVQTVRDGFKSIGGDARDAGRQVDEGMRRMRTAARETVRSGRAVGGYQEKLGLEVARAQERTAAKAEAQRQRQAAAALSNRRREIARDVSERRSHEGRLEQISRAGAEKRAEGERRHRAKLDEIKRASDRRLSSIADRAKEAAASRQSARAFENEILGKRRAYEIEKKRSQLAEQNSLTKGLGGTVKGAVIGGAITTAALAAGVTGAAARDALRLQEVSNRLSISARGAGEEAVDPTALRKEFEATAIRTPGVRSIDIAEAVAQFVGKTGNLDVARKSQDVFATVASATGSQVQDVAAAAADLFQKFDINTVEGMADAMSALAFQGKAGAFELKDAASQFAKLSAAASRFGLDKGAGGVRVLGGLTQIARTATGSPEQAATAVEAMFRQFTSREATKQLRSIGVNPFKDKKGTQTKDVRDLIVETITKSGGNLTKLQGIFGDEGIRAISPIISAFNEAERTQKGTGAASARGVIDNAINAPGDFSDLQKDAAQAQLDASAKLAATWESITSKLADSTIPAIGRLVDTLENSPGAIEGFVGAIETVIGAFEWLVKGVDAWGDLLDDGKINLSNKKKKTAEETRDEERKKAEILKGQLERFDKKRGGSWDEESALRKAGKTKEADAMAAKLRSTAYMDDERRAIAVNLEMAKSRVGRANADVVTSADQKTNIRTAGAFAEEYARMLGPEEYKGQNESRAQLVAKVLRDQTLNGSQYTGQGMLEGETEEARAFRLNQLQARKESLANAGVTQQGQAGQQTADTGIAAAAQKLLAVAGKLDAAAGKIGTQGQASIVPQP
jgi:hypothetical protein